MQQHAVDEAPQTGQREEMLPLLKRHEIQVLRAAGHSQAEVARICEVSERAVRRIEQEQPVTHVDDAAERKRRGLGRPSKAEEWRAFVQEQLKSEPESTVRGMRQRLRQTRGRSTDSPLASSRVRREGAAHPLPG